MTGRNGSSFRVIGIALSFVLIIYFMYSNYDLKSKLQEAYQKIDIAKRSENSLSAEVKKLHTDISSMEKSHQGDRESMIAQNNALRKDYTRLQEKKRELQEQRAVADEAYAKEKEDLTNKVAQLTQQWEATKTSHNTELSNLNDRLQKAESDKQRYLTDHDTCQKNLQLEQVTSSKLESEVAMWKKKYETSILQYHVAVKESSNDTSVKSADNAVGNNENNRNEQPGNPPMQDTHQKGFSAKPAPQSDKDQLLPQLLNKLPIDKRIETVGDQLLSSRNDKSKSDTVDLNHEAAAQRFGNAVKVGERPEHVVNPQIKPPNNNDVQPQGYQKENEANAFGKVADELKEHFNKQQNQNAQLRMPNVVGNDLKVENKNQLPLPNEHKENNLNKETSIDVHDSDKYEGENNDEVDNKEAKVANNLLFEGTRNNMLRPQNDNQQENVEVFKRKEENTGEKMPNNPVLDNGLPEGDLMKPVPYRDDYAAEENAENLAL